MKLSIGRHLCALFLMSGMLATEAARAEACRLEQMKIPVRIVDQRPIATLTLNGTEVPMLVDSGAFYSMLSSSTAEQLKLRLHGLPTGLRIEGYTGRMAAKAATVETVGLLGAELTNVEFIVGGNDLNAGIMGVLGRNILAAGDTEYDLAHGVVQLSFPKGDCDGTNFAYWAGAAPVVVAPLDYGRNAADTAIRLEVRLNGAETLAMLDTGAPQTAMTLRAARRAGLQDGDLAPYGRVGGVGAGHAQAWTARIGAFELRGEKITNNRLEVDDVETSDYGMLVGLDYFLSHRIYVSRLQRKVYVTWNGGPVFALARTAPGEYDARYAAVPTAIEKDDADALARRGAAAIAAGDYPLALDDLNRACELEPQAADHFYDRARLHLTMAHPRLALADLDATLRLAPAMAEARVRRAAVREALGNRAGAREDLQALDAALPPSAAQRADMAQLYAAFDQAPEALHQFDLWIGTHPKDASLAGVLNGRCWLRARFDIELPLALQDCKDALDIDDGAPAIHDSLGWTYLRLGDAARARRAFDDALRLRPQPTSFYGRALARRRLNDPEQADSDLAAARQLDPAIDRELRKQGFGFVDAAKPPAAAGS